MFNGTRQKYGDARRQSSEAKKMK